MGFKDTFEVVGLVWRKTTRLGKLVALLLALIGAWVFADFGGFGSGASDFLLRRGLSLTHSVKIHAEPELKSCLQEDCRPTLSVRGTVEPAPAGDVLPRVTLVCMGCMKDARTTLEVSRNGSAWQIKPVEIDRENNYRLEVVVRKGLRTLGFASYVVDVGEALETGRIAKMYYTDERPKPVNKVKPRLIRIYYFGRSNFSRQVMGTLIGLANVAFRTIEFEVLDSDRADEPAASMPSDPKSYRDSLKALDPGRDEVALLVAITQQQLDENLFSDLFGGRYFVISTSGGLFGLKTTPSVYRYLLIFMSSTGIVAAAEQADAISYHDASRGCVFDYNKRKAEAIAGVTSGHVCPQDLQRLRLSKAAAEDLATSLPMTWLK